MGFPIALIAYYLLPAIMAGAEIRYVAYAGISAGLIGFLSPGLLVKWIAAGLVWKRI